MWQMVIKWHLSKGAYGIMALGKKANESVAIVIKVANAQWHMYETAFA